MGRATFSPIPDPEEFCSILRRTTEKRPFLLLASLSQNGRLMATGRANLDLERKCGAFHPIDGTVLDAAPILLCLVIHL